MEFNKNTRSFSPDCTVCTAHRTNRLVLFYIEYSIDLENIGFNPELISLLSQKHTKSTSLYVYKYCSMLFAYLSVMLMWLIHLIMVHNIQERTQRLRDQNINT